MRLAVLATGASLHLDSSPRAGLFSSRSTPSRRASLQVGPIYLAILCCSTQTRRFFGGLTPVVRDGRHVSNVCDFITDRAFRARTEDSRSGTGAVYPDFQVFQAVIQTPCLASGLSGNLCRKRCAFSRTAETRSTGSSPRQCISLSISNRDYCVVEGSMHVGDSVHDYSF